MKSGSPGCCDCVEGPPFCWPTVHLSDCDGSPIVGATVTISSCPLVSGLSPIPGTTDGSGNYLFPLDAVPPLQASQYNCYTIAWDGVTAGPFYGIDDTIYNCTHTIDFCYRHARVTVNTTSGAAPELAFVPPGWVETGGGTGTITLAYKVIRYCALPSNFPHAMEVDVFPADPTKYLDNCTSLTVDCGDDLAVPVPLFEWDTDYAIHAPTCDEGCAAHGEGPAYRGLTPKHLFLTPSTATGPGLGIYEGVTIPLTWDGTKWDSGCLPAPGVRCCGFGTYGPSYGSARLQVLRDVLGVGDFYFLLTLFASADCTPNTDPSTCPDLRITSDIPATVCTPYFYSPLDVTVGTAGGCGYSGSFHVTE